MLALGETSLCALQVRGLPGERITLNLSSALLRSQQVLPGGAVTLRFPPEAVHIMPVRAGQEPLRAFSEAAD
jgi:molybdate transport system ATP-binding protein